MTARKRAPRKRAVGPVAGRKASVGVERGGAFIRIDDVPADDAGAVVAALLEAFRIVARRFPEILPGPDVIPGGTPVEVVDDYYTGEDRARRVGFR